MNIQYLLSVNYPRGGVRVVIEQANHLARAGHQVRIISTKPEPAWIALEAGWEHIETPPGEILGSTLPPADITVFSFYEQAFALISSIENQQSLPVYFAQGDEYLFGTENENSSEEESNSYQAARNSLKLPFPMITVSNYSRDVLQSRGAKELAVIPNGYDPDLFFPGEKTENTPLRVLAVGAEFPVFKGMKELYAALIKLSRDPETPAFTFVRASPSENAFESLPISVEFHENPEKQELAGLYRSADLFVGASTMESFYLLPLEAMACGTPVVCSDLPALREYAKPQRDFLPVRPGNIADLHDAIKFALRSRKTREMLRQNGLKAAENMRWPNIIPKLEAIFEGMLAERENHMDRLRRFSRKSPVSIELEDDPRA